MNELRGGFDAGHLQAPSLHVDPFYKAIESYLIAAEGKLHKKQVLTLSQQAQALFTVIRTVRR